MKDGRDELMRDGSGIRDPMKRVYADQWVEFDNLPGGVIPDDETCGVLVREFKDKADAKRIISSMALEVKIAREKADEKKAAVRAKMKKQSDPANAPVKPIRKSKKTKVR